MINDRFSRGSRRLLAVAAVVFAAGFASLLATAPARAELTVCNRTDHRLSIAIGYKQDADWVSEGWWNIETGTCHPVVDGDLTHRHYYYADFNARIAGEGYYFCTTDGAFTIVGDENCADHGYERTNFAHLDTGTTATSFTLTINPAPSSAAAETAPASPSLPPTGTYGEPFSVTGILNGCDRVDGLLTCQFDVDGWMYVAYDDNRNLPDTLDYIDALQPGSRVAISGDMVSFGDVSADVVIRSIEVADAATGAGSGVNFDDVAATVAGWWVSADDQSSEIGFTDAITMEEAYAGETLSWLDYMFRDSCLDGAPSNDVYLVTIDRETSDQFCYQVLDYSQDRLVLMYLDRGNILEYGR